MASNDKLKQSLYFPEDMLSEIMKEAVRLDRSLSWMVQHAWRVARDDVRKFPSVDHRPEPARADRQSRSRPGVAEAKPERERGDSSAQVREFLKGKFERELSS
jgi:uncharacterized small protein (TIGR04563 family)